MRTKLEWMPNIGFEKNIQKESVKKMVKIIIIIIKIEQNIKTESDDLDSGF